jgi:hypothetical protein
MSKKIQSKQNHDAPTLNPDDLEAASSPAPGVGRPGSIEQQLDMVEDGPLRGDEILHSHGVRLRNNEHPTLNDQLMDHNFSIDMSEEGREGAEETGDEHSMGMQGGERAELQFDQNPDDTDSGNPGEMTNKLANLDPTQKGYQHRAGGESVKKRDRRRRAA